MPEAITPEEYPNGTWMLGQTQIHRIDGWIGRDAIKVSSWKTTEPGRVDPDKPDETNRVLAAPAKPVVKVSSKQIGKPAATEVPEARPFLDEVEAAFEKPCGIDAAIRNIPCLSELDAEAAKNRCTALVELLIKDGRLLESQPGVFTVPINPFEDDEAEQPSRPTPIGLAELLGKMKPYANAGFTISPEAAVAWINPQAGLAAATHSERLGMLEAAKVLLLASVDQASTPTLDQILSDRVLSLAAMLNGLTNAWGQDA